MPILLPKYITAQDLNDILGTYNNISLSEDDTVICDASEIKFVDPTGLCLLAAILKELSSDGQTIKLVNLPRNIGNYLSRMDLFKASGITYEETFNRHDTRNAFVEIKRLTKQDDADSVASKLAETILGINITQNHITEQENNSYSSLHYIFSELLENSLTHAKRHKYNNTVVWVAAQYYPTKGEIRLCVLDNGCGLFRTLENKLHQHTEKFDSHCQAVETALKPKTTCNPDFGIRGDCVNQGLGLTITNDIISTSKGNMNIATGNAYSFINKNNFRHNKLNHPWTGTIVSIMVKRSEIASLDLVAIINKYRLNEGLDIAFS